MFEGLRRRAANFIMPEKNYNAYVDAFLSSVGGSVNFYDDAKRDTYLTEGYNVNPDVYAVIKQMATKCSDIPFYIKKVKDEKSYHTIRRIKSSTQFQHILKRVKLETKAFEEKELPFPMERPNTQQTWPEFFALSVVFMKLTGNCFWYMIKPTERKNAEPSAVYVLPSNLTYIVVKQNPQFLGIEDPIDYYKLIMGKQYIKFEAQNVIHIKNPNPNFDLYGSHLYGQSDLRAALKNIQSSNEAIQNNIKTMKNGGAFGFIHSKGQNVMSSEQAKAVRDRLTEMDKDPTRLSKIAGVSAELGFTRIALTTDELKPFDYLNYDQKAICNVLGWSTKLLNSTEGTTGLNNGAMDQERKRVITDTIMPLLNQFEKSLNDYFLPLFSNTKGAIIEFDPTELPEMQADMSKLSEWLRDMLDRGALNRDEYRAVMKFDKKGTPEMEAFTVSMNVISLEDALVPLDNNINIEE